MVRRVLSCIIFLAISVLVIGGVSISAQEDILFKHSDQISQANIPTKLGPELMEIINKVEKETNAKIPVSIYLDDEFDATSIDKAAYELTGIDPNSLLQKEELIESKLLEMQMKGVAEIELEKANETYQKELMDEYDKLSKVRNDLISNHVEKAISSFIKESEINILDIDSVCTLIPYIQLVWLSPEKIRELEQNPKVISIDYVDPMRKVEVYVNNARTIIGGDVFLNAGYTGSNIRAGVIDVGHPGLGTASNAMGSDGTYITKTNSGPDDDHPTIVCGIIKRMAPGVRIYTRSVIYVSDIIPAADWLIKNYNVHVINMSIGVLSTTGNFNTYSRAIDDLIYRTKTTICIAAGNPTTPTQTIHNTFINQFGLSPNAITVGAVTRKGTDPAVIVHIKQQIIACTVKR